MKSRPETRLAVVLIALSAVRLLLIGRTDLIPDEAYYFIWSDRLAPCYWDQPAGVAVWNAMMRAIFGTSVFAIRLGAVILSLISSLFLYDLGRVCLRDKSAAANGVLLAQAIPLLSVGAVLMLHDSLLAACALATLAFAARAVLLEKPAWWYATGAAFAAALYAKFSAVLLVIGIGLFILMSHKGRKSLLRPEPYLAGFLAAVLFSPVIAWNARNGWVAYWAVTKLSTDAAMTFGARLASLGDYLASQFALATPILIVFMVWAAVRIFMERKEDEYEGRLYLAAVFAGIFLYFAVQALRAKVQGNWAAVAYAPGALLAADLIAEKWKQKTAKTWAIAGIALAAFATLLIHAHAIHPFLPLPPEADITGQAHGWKGLDNRVREELAKSPPGTAVLARRYQIASELHYALGREADIYAASYAGRGSQYDIWQDFRTLSSRDAIYIDTQGRAAKLFLHFDEAQELPDYQLGPKGRGGRTLHLFRLHGFHMDGPYHAYFASPFQDSLERLKDRVRAGREH